MIRIPEFTFIEWAIVMAILGMVTALVIAAPESKREQDQFMADCQQHEPLYSCQAKWKQIHRDPVVVYAPLNR